jgi:hypothetical protein
VTDLGHLADLVGDDPVASRATARLKARNRASIAVAVGGFGAASVMLLDAMTRSMADDSDAALERRGLAVAGVTALAVWALAPKHRDVSKILDGWNARHPEQPLELAVRERAAPRAVVVACRDPGRLGAP